MTKHVDFGDTIRQRFIDDVNLFKRESGIPTTALCYELTGNRGLMSRIKRGRNVSLATLERIESWMSAWRAQADLEAVRSDAQATELPAM